MAGASKSKVQVKRNTAKYQKQEKQASLTKSGASSSKPGTASSKSKAKKASPSPAPVTNVTNRKASSGPELDTTSKDLDSIWKATKLVMGKKPSVYSTRHSIVSTILVVPSISSRRRAKSGRPYSEDVSLPIFRGKLSFLNYGTLQIRLQSRFWTVFWDVGLLRMGCNIVQL